MMEISLPPGFHATMLNYGGLRALRMGNRLYDNGRVLRPPAKVMAFLWLGGERL